MEALTAGPSSNASTAPEALKASREGTEYVILKCVKADGDEAWRPYGHARTPQGADSAIKQACAGQPGSYKAVPVRNWRGGLELGTETRTVTVTKPIRD